MVDEGGEDEMIQATTAGQAAQSLHTHITLYAVLSVTSAHLGYLDLLGAGMHTRGGLLLLLLLTCILHACKKQEKESRNQNETSMQASAPSSPPSFADQVAGKNCNGNGAITHRIRLKRWGKRRGGNSS
uniref:Uncharacterized protein n=1 Tax=Oryza nivara TaxID=4536 RepID=A0A0E0G4K3_ORYNI